MHFDRSECYTAEQVSGSAVLFAFLALTGVIVLAANLLLSGFIGRPFGLYAQLSLISYSVSTLSGFAIAAWLHQRGRRLAFVDADIGRFSRFVLRIPPKRRFYGRKLVRLPPGVRALNAIQHIASMAGIVTLGMWIGQSG